MYAFGTVFNSYVSIIINISYLFLILHDKGSRHFFLKISSKYYCFLCFLEYFLANVTRISPLLSPEKFKYLGSLLSVIDKSCSFLSCFAVS